MVYALKHKGRITDSEKRHLRKAIVKTRRDKIWNKTGTISVAEKIIRKKIVWKISGNGKRKEKWKRHLKLRWSVVKYEDTTVRIQKWTSNENGKRNMGYKKNGND